MYRLIQTQSKNVGDHSIACFRHSLKIGVQIQNDGALFKHAFRSIHLFFFLASILNKMSKISFISLLIFNLSTITPIRAHEDTLNTHSFSHSLLETFSSNGAPFNQPVEVSPIELVCPKRADLMAKYLYAKLREWGTSCAFGQEVYYNHLKVWNEFYEESPRKINFSDFLTSFNALLDSIKSQGFDPMRPIPVRMNGVINNGAHRVTSCLLYQKKITLELDEGKCECDFNFFKTRGLQSLYLDAMALQYCELKPQTYIMTVFPSAKGKEALIEGLIKKYAEIVYAKEVYLTCEGGFHFILTAYEGESFLDENSNYRGARHKAQLCFPPDLSLKNPMRVYLLEAKDLDLIKQCKKEIRNECHISNHSVHSTDTHQQAITLARTLFNDNSIHCLNHRKERAVPQFTRYFEKYRQWLNAQYEKSEWFIIDSGAVLAAYGLRDAHDVDVLQYGEDSFDFPLPGIENHHDQLHYHTLPLDELMFNPNNYFYYKGIKFCSLSVLKQMKQKRKEAKDLVDLKLIEELDTKKTPNRERRKSPPSWWLPIGNRASGA